MMMVVGLLHTYFPKRPTETCLYTQKCSNKLALPGGGNKIHVNDASNTRGRTFRAGVVDLFFMIK